MEVNVGIPSSGRPVSRAYVTYRSIFGNMTSEIVQLAHFIENTDAYRQTTETTPFSSSIQSSSVAVAPNCYTGHASAAAGDSTAQVSSNSVCYQGPPPPPTPITQEPISGDCGADPHCQASPIVLDLGSGTYELTSVDDGVQFDLDARGSLLRTAWTRRDDDVAFLARDLNANGIIDDGAELFGTATLLADGTRAANGFDALRQLDTNGDEVGDAADAGWPSLLLWTDRDHDGRSASSELQPIAATPIVSLGVTSTRVGRRDAYGNQLRYHSWFAITGQTRPTRRVYYDVFFQVIRQ